MRRHEAKGVPVPAVDAAKHGVADAYRFLQHGFKDRLKIAQGELLITRSTSDVAVCCSSASVSSVVRSVSPWCAGAVR